MLPLPKEIAITLIHLNNVLQRNHMNFMVLGSIALRICGLKLGRPIHDIDILVECDENKKENLKMIGDMSGVKQGSDSSCIVFSINGITVNAWCTPKLDREFVVKEDIKFATVFDTLKVKADYHRPKDFEDLTYLCNVISYLLIKDRHEHKPQGVFKITVDPVLSEIAELQADINR